MLRGRLLSINAVLCLESSNFLTRVLIGWIQIFGLPHGQGILPLSHPVYIHTFMKMSLYIKIYIWHILLASVFSLWNHSYKRTVKADMVQGGLAASPLTSWPHLFAILWRSVRGTGATPIVIGALVSTASRWLVWTIGRLLILLIFSLSNSWGRSWARRAPGAEKREHVQLQRAFKNSMFCL